MKTYEVIAFSANLNSGIIFLNDEQALRRRHSLEKIKDGVYKIITPIQFKRGEVFGYNEEVNKALLQDITPVKEEIFIKDRENKRIKPSPEPEKPKTQSKEQSKHSAKEQPEEAPEEQLEDSTEGAA